jgi:phosphohistidine phosphatase
MKSLFLIRHAKSSWEDPSLKDFDRPLNPRGLRDAPFMSKLLKGKGIVVDQIVSSPANRALSTAKYFAEAFGINNKKIILRNEIYEAYPEDVMAIVKELPNEVDVALIFGHNPTFTSLANQFGGYLSNVPTCGVVRIDAEIDKWADFSIDTAQRTAFHYPKQYFS